MNSCFRSYPYKLNGVAVSSRVSGISAYQVQRNPSRTVLFFLSGLSASTTLPSASTTSIPSTDPRRLLGCTGREVSTNIETRDVVCMLAPVAEESDTTSVGGKVPSNLALALLPIDGHSSFRETNDVNDSDWQMRRVLLTPSIRGPAA